MGPWQVIHKCWPGHCGCHGCLRCQNSRRNLTLAVSVLQPEPQFCHLEVEPGCSPHGLLVRSKKLHHAPLDGTQWARHSPWRMCVISDHQAVGSVSAEDTGNGDDHRCPRQREPRGTGMGSGSSHTILTDEPTLGGRKTSPGSSVPGLRPAPPRVSHFQP